VANALRLLALPPFALSALASGELTAGHARAIAGGADPDALARIVIEKGLTVRQAEALARDAGTNAGAKPAPRRPPGKPDDVVALEQDLTETLGFGVEIAVREGRGSLRIDFTSLEELDKLCQRLSR
jgi:ParB family chromosome partitioning protein